jgi:sulfate transport system ATP-binding protein
MMEIGNLGHRYPEQISGGQRQRVALARALAIEPKLLLLDEPFGALDAKVRKSLRIWLRALHDRMGLTSVFVTHDQAEAMEMADRVAVLRAGQIEQVDVPDKLYAEPASAFVHEFMGESVRFDCMVGQGGARIAGLSCTVPAGDCPLGSAIALIRPHEIGLLPGSGPARVDSVHVYGPLRRVRLTFAGRILEVLRNPDVWTPLDGETCNLDLSKARIYPSL